MTTIPTISAEAGLMPAFTVAEPQTQSIPFVFSSPHSGSHYPQEFLAGTRLAGEAIRRSEDLFVDALFEGVSRIGAPLIAANFPRAFLDVNREPYELDQRMFAGTLPGFANATSVRVAGGLGTIPRIVAENQEIYRDKLTVEEGLARIERYYRPFHDTLENLLTRTRRQFGIAILVDCHSMPSSVRAIPSERRSDIVVGDRFGTSAAGRIVEMAVRRLVDQGFDVARNRPYAGGYITEHYGRPAIGFHAIQVEINRSLYADEIRYRPHAGFDRTAERLSRFTADFAADMAAEYAWPIAAE